jgi:hypothetical protein
MSGDVARTALAGRWYHSHEEDTEGRTVFRPESYPLPPSRGRRSFELHPDGRMINYGIGADDRPAVSQGSWRLGDGNALEFTPEGSDALSTVMQVDSLTPEKLVVKRQVP